MSNFVRVKIKLTMCRCDTPYYLGLAALQSIGPLTGTGDPYASPAWTIYTGDLVSHDHQNQLSKAYVEYTETAIYDMFKSYINGPVYAVLGNHDSSPEAIDAPHSMPGPLGEQFSWNYEHVSSLWKNNGWIDNTTAQQAATHYAGYSVKNQEGLRIITLNTDFWYKANYLNFINTTDPDVSGSLRFLINELQAAEDAGERVWIIGHVLSGWSGTDSMPTPSDLFYQIVDRYSPHVIANIFWGHTHEDQVMIYYSNNGTVMNSSTAQAAGWMGPSVTPLTNLNSGYRVSSTTSLPLAKTRTNTQSRCTKSTPAASTSTTPTPSTPTSPPTPPSKRPAPSTSSSTPPATPTPPRSTGPATRPSTPRSGTR